MAYNPNNPNGQTTSANSAPVVLASDQTAIPITDNGGSVTIDGTVGVSGTVTISGTVTANVGTGTQPVSGTVEIGATSLAALETISVANFPATQAVSGTVTANAGTGTMNVSVQNASIPVTDNGGSLTIDGSVSVSNFPATQPISGTVDLGTTTLTALESITVQNGAGASAVNIQDGGNSITIDGSVSVSNFPATQPVSGTVELGTTSLTALETISVANFPATQPVSGTVTVQDGGSSITVDGSVSVSNFPATQNVSVQNASLAVTGTFFQATQPVSGTVTADTELPAAVALGDSTANPTTTLVGSALEGFNGTTFDRVRTIDALTGTGANSGTLGVLAVGTGPGFSHRYNPANLGTAVNSVSAIEVEGGNTMSFAIGTTTTGTFIFEATADATNWISVEVFDAGLDMWVSGQNLTPTLGKVYHLSVGGYRQIRLRTTATLGATVAHTANVSASQQLLAGVDTGAAPHNFGYLIVHRDGEYATAQTGTALWTPTTGKKFAVTDISITTGGTTAGIVTVWQGAAADTTYTVGTDPALFRGEFAPSANAKPGAIKSFNVPYISTTIDHVLRVTTSAAMTVYIQVNGYEI